MADKIRVGIVGATVTQGGSGWGQNAHVPALKALPSYELKAVCTAHEDTAKASAAAFGAERAFHRFSDMAAHPEVDLIVVCVRVPGHRELVVAGLQAGKPVFGVRANGANTLTIAGGHAIDTMCAVLGELAELAARVSTRIPEWRTLEGKPVPVDSPDSISVVGRMASGAEVSINVAAVPSHPSGNRLEIYGRDGALVIRANGALSLGPNQLHAGRGKESMVAMPVPAKYKFTPEGTPAGQPYNVAQAYARAADAVRGGGAFDVDFNLAVRRHKLIDAIERSSATGRAVRLDQ